MADILTEPKELKLIVQDSIFIKFTDLFFVVSFYTVIFNILSHVHSRSFLYNTKEVVMSRNAVNAWRVNCALILSLPHSFQN